VLAASASADAATREEDLNALRARIAALKSELESRETDRREARDALRASESAISEATRTLATLEAQRREARDELGRLAERQRILEQELAARQSTLGRLLAARAASGAPDIVRLTLSGQDPGEVARQLYYLSILSRAAACLIEADRAGLGELERLRGESANRARELGEIESQQRSDRERVLAERRERRRVLERIAGELRLAQREMNRMLADEQRLARLVREISRVLASRPGAGYQRSERLAEPGTDGQPFASLRGSLGMPVRGELVGRFQAQQGAKAGSKGLFIRAAEGEPVRAVAAGRVVYADWMRGFGNLLIVDHGDAYLSIYGNNESLLKQPGDSVSAGETVATVGASGGRDESGVYFELRHLGQAFDPLRWVKVK
jgi:septal ring factor EnvC (AmiA/AmiB activator)